MLYGVLCPSRWRTGTRPLTHCPSTYIHTHSDAFASYTAKSTRQTLWGWVAQHDELLLEMRAGHVFADFSEGPITFPPPFRWRVGKHAGDYTSVRTWLVECGCSSSSSTGRGLSSDMDTPLDIPGGAAARGVRAAEEGRRGAHPVVHGAWALMFE